MQTTSIPQNFSRRVVSVIMGGGAGTRLFPLTKDRSKPAVPLGGKYRLVDIPISNCINSDLKRIFLLTQFNSSSLHRHVQQSFRFDTFSGGFIEIVAAQQTPKSAAWYQGTADAVRQNLNHFGNHQHDLVLILSGDQLYRTDFRVLLQQHVDSGAGLTVATIPVKRDCAKEFGIMQVDANRKVVRFVEKPKDDALLDSLRMDPATKAACNQGPHEDNYLASMGIYVFNRDVLAQALSGTETDFGKHIIPQLIAERHVNAFVYQGYWEDIGTIKAFFEANLDMCEINPNYNVYEPGGIIYSHARYLPASRLLRCQIDRGMIAEGCLILEAKIEHSIIGIRSRIAEGCTIKDTIVMGHDYFETQESMDRAKARNIPKLGIGRNTYIERAIIDKDTRIGENVRISPEGKPSNFDGENFYIRDGIVVITKGTVIPDGTVI